MSPISSLVERRSQALIEEALDLAERGALYAARAQFIEVLENIGHARDGALDVPRFHTAIVTGLLALEEADDFALGGSTMTLNHELAGLIAAHRTPVLKNAHPGSLTRLTAARRYCDFAQQQLLNGCIGVPIASQALFGLGRLEAARATTSSEPNAIGCPKAMVIYETALRVDPRNYLAANELAVLLAEYGQYDEARDFLWQSIQVFPTSEAWFNLAAVHRRLGDPAQAAFAAHQHQTLLEQGGGQRGHAKSKYHRVRWVDPVSFLEESPAESIQHPSTVQSESAASRSWAAPSGSDERPEDRRRSAAGETSSRPRGLTQRLKSLFQ